MSNGSGGSCQQRENFLPLKIIRGRLTEQDDDEAEPGEDGTEVAGLEGSLFAADSGAPADSAQPAMCRPRDISPSATRIVRAQP